MKFSTKGVEAKERSFVSKYFQHGIQRLMVTDIDVTDKFNGESKNISFTMETPKIEEKGFEPNDYSKQGGQTNWVQATYPVKLADEASVTEFMEKIALIATKLGVKDALDAIEAPTLEAYMAAVLPIIKGKFAWWAITAREYIAADGKVRTSLNLRRYGFIASDADGESRLKPFDMNNKYDYQALDVAPDTDGAPDELDKDTSVDPW